MGCCAAKEDALQPARTSHAQPQQRELPPDVYYHPTPQSNAPQRPPSVANEHPASRQRARPPAVPATELTKAEDYAAPPQQTSATRGSGPAPPQHRSPTRQPPPPRPPVAVKTARRSSHSGRHYGVGERVDAVWSADGFWYAAWVTATKRGEPTCGIVFDDLVEVDHQPLQQLRPRFARGECVECRWQGGPDYYRGVINQVIGEGVYSIHYDDGDYEHNCPCHLIRIAREPSALSKGPLPPPGFSLMRLASQNRIIKGGSAAERASGRGGVLITSYGHTVHTGGGGAPRA